MSIGEGDPRLSAYSLINMIRDEIVERRLGAEEIRVLAERFPLGIDLSNLVDELEFELELTNLGKMIAEQLRSLIDSGEIDFWEVNDFLEDHFKIPQEEKHDIKVRKAQIKGALDERMRGAGMALMLERVDFSAPENKETINEIFEDVERRCLQELGVLDENGNVIPGQEPFA